MITNFFITSFLKTMSGQSGLIAVMASFLLCFDSKSSCMSNSLSGLMKMISRGLLDLGYADVS